MNPARRTSPDSEAIASSEDEKPWPSSMKFGNLPMDSSVPGIPGGIWMPGRRESFRIAEATRRTVTNGPRDSRLANNPHAPQTTPSPSTSDGNGALPFSIPLQPTPKTGRSMSHSQGQRDFAQNAPPSSSTVANPHPAALPLGLLAEDTESDFELGEPLTQTVSHPPIGTFMRTQTMPSTYTFAGNDQNGRMPSNQMNGARPALPSPTDSFGRMEQSFGSLALDPPLRRAMWHTSLGWDNAAKVNESRRHSLADIPTRRGSLSGDHPPEVQAPSVGRTIVDISKQQDHYEIPSMYRTPHLDFRPYDQSVMQQPALASSGANSWGAAAPNRPRKLLYMVSFKCARVDVFYLLENTGLTINEGDLVIVEADRGQDLGTVQHAKVTPEEARSLKKRYSEEQYKWLMMYSRNSSGGNNPNAQPGENSGHVAGDAVNSVHSVPRSDHSNLKPKAIKRLASDREIRMLTDKEGNEAKAKRTCQQKVAHLHLQMEILDAEWQWDFQKLIFYYYADHYINFKDLITELYRIYKTRIWLGAVNPASFSQHLISQPPSGIGPGAVVPFNPYAGNNAYTMTYGEDKDPYGAQMPYQIPYDTYTPNYPAIPGVANSFAPSARANPYSATFTPTRSMDSMSVNAAQASDVGSAGLSPSAASVYSQQQPVVPPGYNFAPQDRTAHLHERDAAYQHQRSSAGGANGPENGGLRATQATLNTTQRPDSGPWNPLSNGQSARFDRQNSLPSPIGTRSTGFARGPGPMGMHGNPAANVNLHPGMISLGNGLGGNPPWQ